MRSTVRPPVGFESTTCSELGSRPMWSSTSTVPLPAAGSWLLSAGDTIRMPPPGLAARTGDASNAATPDNATSNTSARLRMRVMCPPCDAPAETTVPRRVSSRRASPQRRPGGSAQEAALPLVAQRQRLRHPAVLGVRLGLLVRQQAQELAVVLQLLHEHHLAAWPGARRGLEERLHLDEAALAHHRFVPLAQCTRVVVELVLEGPARVLHVQRGLVLGRGCVEAREVDLLHGRPRRGQQQLPPHVVAQLVELGGEAP